jgi:catalase
MKNGHNHHHPLGLGWHEIPEGGSYDAEKRMIKQWAADMEEVQRENQDTIRKQAAEGDTDPDAKADLPQRPLHAKMRVALANAQFRVSDDIPEFLRVGFLQPGNTYRATLRISNGSGVPKPDYKGDLRGFALRLHLEDEDSPIQDFLMTNAPRAHYRNAGQFLAFLKAMASRKIWELPLAIGLWETIRMLFIAKLQTLRRVKSLATERYWSRAPFALRKKGEKSGGYAFKFALVPGSCPAASVPNGDDYLREDFNKRLRRGAIFFEFRVQLFVNDEVTPIEDVSVEWKEVDSPFFTIGELYIPPQNLDSFEAQAMALKINDLAFNIWNRIPEIVPIGGANRARPKAYEAVANQREANQEDTET